MLNAGCGALDVGLCGLQRRTLGVDLGGNLLPVKLGQQLALVDVLIDVHVKVLHDPAGLGLQFNLGNGLHFTGGDHALIDFPTGDFVQTAGVEVGPATAHAHNHQPRNHDDGQQTAPDPDAFTFALRSHKTPDVVGYAASGGRFHAYRRRYHDFIPGFCAK